jgi:hypothetical protein
MLILLRLKQKVRDEKVTLRSKWTPATCRLTTAATIALQSTFACREGLDDNSIILSVSSTSTPHCH